MTRWRLLGAVTAAVGALALAPVQASANVGQPLDLGVGQNPNVTLEPDGTADIAFTGQGANSTELDYCKLPPGATACSVRSVVPAPGDSLTIPLAFGSGNNVTLISYRYGLSGANFSQVLLFTSGDGGNTWAGGTPIGTIPPFDYAFGPSGLISAVTNAVTAELDYQAWTLTGNTTNKAVLDGDPYEYLGSVAMIDPNTPIVVYASRGGDGRFRRYTGIGDVNDQASWTPAADIGTIDRPHVVSGPSGVILLGQNELSGPKLEARRYDGTTFGSRTLVKDGVHADHAVEDGEGRVHVVSSQYGGKTGSQFFYATSYDGSTWVNEGIDYPSLPQNLRLAMNPNHFGVATGTLYGNGHVFAARVGPAAAEITPGKFVGVSAVSGIVLVRIPPSQKFVPLHPGDVIPVGSVIDATKGRVSISIGLPGGKTQTSDFYQGIFKVTQKKSGLATMVLTGGNTRVCGRGAAVRAAKVKVIRQLWGNGKGKFATKGRYASAAIRGTTWDTIDRCDGTQIKVTKGQVLVTDFKAHKKVVVKAGHSYLARA